MTWMNSILSHLGDSFYSTLQHPLVHHRLSVETLNSPFSVKEYGSIRVQRKSALRFDYPRIEQQSHGALCLLDCVGLIL
jgi:hypothetical protein